MDRGNPASGSPSLRDPLRSGGRPSARYFGAFFVVVLLLVVLLPVAHRVLEVLDPFAEALAELRDLSRPEDQDDDDEDDEKFRESDIGHGRLLEARGIIPRRMSGGRKPRSAAQGPPGVVRDRRTRRARVAMGPVDRPSRARASSRTFRAPSTPAAAGRPRHTPRGPSAHALAGPLEAEGDRVVVRWPEAEVLEVDQGEPPVGRAHEVVRVEVAVGRDGVARGGRVRRGTGEVSGEPVPGGSVRLPERRPRLPARAPSAACGRVHGRRTPRRRAGSGARRPGRASGARRAAPRPRRGAAGALRAASISISTARSRSPRSSTRAAPRSGASSRRAGTRRPAAVEGRADGRPVGLRGRGRLGVEDDEDARPSRRRPPEVAACPDIAGERRLSLRPAPVRSAARPSRDALLPRAPKAARRGAGSRGGQFLAGAAGARPRARP